MSLSARSITSRCSANVPATRLSCWMEAMMLSRCCVKDADEVVEAGEQLADLGFTSGQRGVEVVDDVTDLSQPARVDDRRQRRQRLLGGGIGRRLVQADGGSGLQSAAWLFTERRVERQVHRSQQAGLPNGGYRIGGHHDVGLDRDLDVGVPVRRPSSCRRCRRRRR